MKKFEHAFGAEKAFLLWLLHTPEKRSQSVKSRGFFICGKSKRNVVSSAVCLLRVQNVCALEVKMCSNLRVMMHLLRAAYPYMYIFDCYDLGRGSLNSLIRCTGQGSTTAELCSSWHEPTYKSRYAGFISRS